MNKHPSKIFFSGFKYLISMILGLLHLGVQPIIVGSNAWSSILNIPGWHQAVFVSTNFQIAGCYSFKLQKNLTLLLNRSRSNITFWSNDNNVLTLTYFLARLNFATFQIFDLFLTLICEMWQWRTLGNLLNLALYNQLIDDGRIMREQDQGLLSHVNQMRVQQYERSRALVVLVPIFIHNV